VSLSALVVLLVGLSLLAVRSFLRRAIG
jgi:hypothetical protein